MLPLHGQSTAAVEQLSVTGQVRLLMVKIQGAMFLINRRGPILPSSFRKFYSVIYIIALDVIHKA